MKFVDKWPNAKAGEEPDPHAGMFKTDGKATPCCMCKQRTRWVSLNWMAPLCSEECEEKLIKEYEEHRNPPDFWTEAEENNNES